jgi:hypothetical protein
VNKELEKIGFYHVRITDDQEISTLVAQMKGDSNIEYVEANPTLRCFDLTINDPNYDQQWALKAINAPQAWGVTEGNSKVLIAVIDSGVEFEHPDLLDNLVDGYNFLDEIQLPSDDYGHGTQVAGIIAAGRNNGIGICGLANGCRIMPLKVLDDNGEGTCADVAKAIIYAADNGCKIINLSLGTYAWSEVLKASVNYAAAHDCIIIAAAGNDGSSERCYPAAWPSVISVAAVDRDLLSCGFSNRGDYVDIAAPGKAVLTTTTNSGYELVSGTSAACAYVSGLAGLAASANMTTTAKSIRAAFLYTAQDVGDAGWEPETGMGVINCISALSEQQVSDIDIGIVDISVLPAKPLPGQNVTVRATIRNHGTGISGPLNVALKYKENTVSSALIPQLEPKFTTELSLSCKALPFNGTAPQNFTVCAYPLANETKTDDNIRSFDIVTTSLPVHDIAIQRCRTEGTPLFPGSTVTVYVDLVNLGNQPEENVPFEFFCRSQQVQPNCFISLPVGGVATIRYDCQIPLYTPGPNDLVPVYFLSFRLGELPNEANTADNRFDLRLGYNRQSDSVSPLHLMEEGTEVHQWISQEAYDYFTDQIAGADISAYLGSISASQADNRNNIIEGTAAEDKDDRPPLYQTMPYLRHFCAGADGSEIYDGYSLLWNNYDSALTQAQNIWQSAINAYAGNRPLSFYYLGHVVHLLADMTVPAHVHNDPHVASLGDPDEYEETIGHNNNYKLWYYAGGRSGNWLYSLSLPTDLTTIFYQTTNFTEDYDSGDYDGDGPPYYFPSDYTAQWHLPNMVDRHTGGIDMAEITLIGDDLMPYAIRRTAELYRLFYKAVDTSAPSCTIIYPAKEDPNEPDYRISPAAFSLIAEGNDVQSGVLKESYHFRYALWTGQSWSAWTDITPSPTSSSISFNPPADDTLYAFSVYIWNGAGIASQSQTKYLFVDSTAPQTSIAGFSDPNENEQLVSGNSYSYPTPHFHFSFIDGGSGVKGYYYSLGTDPNETPAIWDTRGDYTASGLLIGTNYYLRVAAVDKAGNIALPVTFFYRYTEPCSVDFDDLVILCAQWLSTGDSLAPDFDHNGIVDFVDFAIFSSHWLNLCPPDWPL